MNINKQANTNDHIPIVGNLYEIVESDEIIVVVAKIFVDESYKTKELQQRVEYYRIHDKKSQNLRRRYDLCCSYFNMSYQPLNKGEHK